MSFLFKKYFPIELDSGEKNQSIKMLFTISKPNI